MDLGQLDYLKVLVLAENTARPGTNFWGQHGASFLLQAQRGSVKQAILVDVGQSPSVLRHNMDEFGIAPSEVDAVVITHCHYDHTGGIAAFLEKTGKENIPVVGHPDIFRLNFRTVPHLKCRGTDLKDQPSEIEKHGGRLFLTKDPLQLMPGLLTTGEVPRVVGFEQPEDTFFTIRQGRIEEDGLEDDVSVVANVQGRGLVVITGCSHAGIINIIRQAMEMFPGVPLDGVIGGFHLIKAAEARIKRTVEELVKFNPRFVSAGHCTGFKAQAALWNGLQDKFVPLACGLEFVVSTQL